MASLATSMTTLINKIERRLGTEPLNLPIHLQKNKWGEVIETDTLVTFSRFFPHKLLYQIDILNDKGKDGYYYIDQNKIPGDVVILGIRDLSFDRLAQSSSAYGYGGYIDPYVSSNSYEVTALNQMMADLGSTGNNGLFIDFIPPNKLSIRNASNHSLSLGQRFIDIEVFVRHSKSLATIHATKMETFEELAIIDIKMFLYNGLKYYDGLETVYANIDLKIQEWQNAEGDRRDFVERLRDQYVSSANAFQPMIFTV